MTTTTSPRWYSRTLNRSITPKAKVLFLSTDGFRNPLRSPLKLELQVSTWMCDRLGTPIPDGHLVDYVALKRAA
jgi:hypothetical protein